MPDVTYDGQTVSVNDEGFFTDSAAWTEQMAPQIAKAEGIDHLTGRHWQVIRFMRHEYQAKGTSPTVRVLGKILNRVYHLINTTREDQFPHGQPEADDLIGGDMGGQRNRIRIGDHINKCGTRMRKRLL